MVYFLLKNSVDISLFVLYKHFVYDKGTEF